MAIYVVSLTVRRNHPHHSRAVLGAAALAVLGVAALAVLGVAGVDGEVKVVQRQAERRFTNSEFIRILKECQGDRRSRREPGLPVSDGAPGCFGWSGRRSGMPRRLLREPAYPRTNRVHASVTVPLAWRANRVVCRSLSSNAASIM